MKNIKYFTFTLVLIFCLIRLVSFGWSIEKPKAPSSAVVIPSPVTRVSSPPFSIKVNDRSEKYLNSFAIHAELVPRDDSQTAKDAIADKIVDFYIDGKFVGADTCQGISNRYVELSISENYSRQLNLQTGKHEVVAQTRHTNQVIKGYGTLTINKAPSHIVNPRLMPQKNNKYTIGETVAFSGILKTEHDYPITQANVACISFDATWSIKKILFSVKTNNQGGFECPIILTPNVFYRQHCNVHYGFIGVAFLGNQNFQETGAEHRAIIACPAGMNYATYCSTGCAVCCK